MTLISVHCIMEPLCQVAQERFQLLSACCEACVGVSGYVLSCLTLNYYDV
jgi:hypothetical protein